MGAIPWFKSSRPQVSSPSPDPRESVCNHGSGKGGPSGDGVTGAVGNAASACLYSGLEDGSEGGPSSGPGAPPQNWGHTHKAPFVLDSRGASWVSIDATIFGAPPGTVVEEGCNPHVGGEG